MEILIAEKFDGISWRPGKSQDSKLFLWFATRQEEKGEQQESSLVKSAKFYFLEWFWLHQ